MNLELKKAILNLSDKLFGKSYLDQLEVYLKDENSKVISEVSREGILMGFSVVRVLTFEQLKAEFYEYPTQLNKHFKPDHLIGFRKSTAVSPMFQKSGYSHQNDSSRKSMVRRKSRRFDFVVLVKKRRNGVCYNPRKERIQSHRKT